RSANTSISLLVQAPRDPAEHMVMGNPSDATTDAANPTNYLLPKSQYVMSYHRDRGTPNWVSWHLDSSWIGSTPRQDDFRNDPSLPASWYQVQSTDYSGSGFDRGHHTPSGDRTSSVPDNSATFFMTNMMPQAPFNNQGPWEELESYCRTLVSQGNELYIIAGGAGIGGTGSNGGVTTTIASGRVTVPAVTWKVIIVLPVGSNDVDRVYKTTRVIAVIMPNNQSIGLNTPWRNFRTSIDRVEGLTGFNFFSNVRPMVQNLIERKVDQQ
ncbi:MAG: DNA/RNA non-specific endonuclease, partial [Acidobacteriota bacterium]